MDTINSEAKIAKALAITKKSAGVGGEDHKTWVIDQMVRALLGCPMIEDEATNYETKKIYKFVRQGESDLYLEWVKDYEKGEDGPKTYEWDEGIAP